MKKILVRLLKATGILLIGILLYLAGVFLIPYIEIPAKPATEGATVEIFILSNGMHTDLVVPVKSQYFDWTEDIKFEDTHSQNSDFEYVGIGWGDKGFYLDTPTWAELKVSTALKAAFWLSTSAMHCTFYNKFPEGEEYRRLRLTPTEYRNLVNYIRAKFDRDAQGRTLKVETDAVYGDNDAFYEAHGKYSFVYTCNTWTNNGLKIAGKKAALWTALEHGIFLHYPQNESAAK